MLFANLFRDNEMLEKIDTLELTPEEKRQVEVCSYNSKVISEKLSQAASRQLENDLQVSLVGVVIELMIASETGISKTELNEKSLTLAYELIDDLIQNEDYIELAIPIYEEYDLDLYSIVSIIKKALAT